ncbi:MAG: HAD family hydrolase [Candidatus Fermentibacteraceae bacterium]|nr:HAD family hydrolase [Candidatus Fermentibacteraceae bacterium]
MKYKAVLFDLDGTLLDYRAAQKASTGNTAGHFKLVNSPEVQNYESRGVPLPDSTEMKRVFIGFGVHTDPVKFLDTYFKRLSQHGILVAGAAKLLEELNGKVKLAVVSNGHSSVQLPRMQKAGIASYFPHLFFSRDMDIAKPDPEILRIAINTLGVTPEETLFIGDSTTSDQPAANSAGIDFFLFKGNYSDPELRKLLL